VLAMLLVSRPDETHARWLVQAQGLLVGIRYVVALDQGLVFTCGSDLKVVYMQVKAFVAFTMVFMGKGVQPIFR
jgi:hypothetical protein